MEEEEEPKLGELAPWQRMQYKSFRGWANRYLPPHLQITTLSTAFQDGLLLAKLLKDLSGDSVKGLNKNAKMKIHRINNLFHCFNFMKLHNIKLQNISAEDIEECDLKLIVALIWHLIMHYELQLEDGGTAKDRLLERLNNFLQDSNPLGPEHAPLVNNFDTNFQDGLIFFYMIQKHRPELLPISDPLSMNRPELLETVFGILNAEWGIPQLISIPEMISAKPDEKSIMTYVALCLDGLTRTASNLTAPETAEKMFRKSIAASNKSTGGPDRVVELLFSLDLTISCLQTARIGQDTEKQGQLRKAQRSLRALQSRIQTDSSDFEKVRAEVESEYARQFQVITADPEHQRQVKLRQKRWRRKAKETKEDIQINEWSATLKYKLETPPSSSSLSPPDQEKHALWNIRRSIKGLEELMVQCRPHFRVPEFDAGWFKVVVDSLVRNIRHALPYLLRRLLSDTKTDSLDSLAVFSGEIDVESLDMEHNPFYDLVHPLVGSSVDLLRAFSSFRRQTDQSMMTTITTKATFIRETSFSLHNLLHHYLDPHASSPSASSDLDSHRLRRIEYLHWLVVHIKLLLQQRFWRQPEPYNQVFDATELYDSKWISLINPIWVAVVGKQLAEAAAQIAQETSDAHAWKLLRERSSDLLHNFGLVVRLLSKQWTSYDESEFSSEFCSLRKTLFASLARPLLTNEVHRSGQELMATSPLSFDGIHELAEDLFNVACASANDESIGKAKEWLAASPARVLLSSTKSVVLERERLIEVETSKKVLDHRLKKATSDLKESSSCEEKPTVRATTPLSDQTKESKAIAHARTVDGDAENKRQDEKLREREKRERDEEAAFQQVRDELEHSRGEWQRYRVDRKKEKRIATHKREATRTTEALALCQKLIDAFELSAHGNDERFREEWIPTTINALVAVVRKIANAEQVRGLTVLAFDNVAEFHLGLLSKRLCAPCWSRLQEGADEGREEVYINSLARRSLESVRAVRNALKHIIEQQPGESTSTRSLPWNRNEATQTQFKMIVRYLEEKLATPFYTNGGGWRLEIDWLVSIVHDILLTAKDSCDMEENTMQHPELLCQIIDNVRAMVDLMDQHLGTEVKIKKRFLDLRENLFRDLDTLHDALSNFGKCATRDYAKRFSAASADTRDGVWDKTIQSLSEHEHKKSRKRPPPEEIETTQQWAEKLLSQMASLMPSAEESAEIEEPEGISLEDIDMEQEQTESAAFMNDAEEGLHQLEEISSMMDPKDMDVDEFDDTKLKIKVRIFFDTNKKALLFLRKKSRQTFMRLAIQTQDLVNDSRGLLDTVDDYKNTLSEKFKAKVLQKAKGMKESVQGLAKSVTSAVKEESERLQELAARILAAESSDESEEEPETSALQSINDRLAGLSDEIDTAHSRVALSPTQDRHGNPSRSLHYQRRSWHSRQLGLSSIDVYLKQNKLENEVALLSQTMSYSHTIKGRKAKDQENQRKKRMKKLRQCVTECHTALVRQLEMEGKEGSSLAAEGKLVDDMRWFLYILCSLLRGGKELLFLGESSELGEDVLDRARAVCGGLYKIMQYLEEEENRSSTRVLDMHLNNIVLLRGNLLQDLDSYVSSLRSLRKKSAADHSRSSTVGAMENLIQEFEIVERSWDRANSAEGQGRQSTGEQTTGNISTSLESDTSGHTSLSSSSSTSDSSAPYPSPVTAETRKQEKRLRKYLAFLSEVEAIQTCQRKQDHERDEDCVEVAPQPGNEKALRKLQRRTRREERAKRREWKKWKREQNVARMCETLRSVANDLRSQLVARLWEPHVVAGQWVLNPTYLVDAAKELVRVAEETLDQVTKSPFEDLAGKDNESTSETGGMNIENVRQAIVDSSSTLYTAVENLAGLLTAHSAQDEEARRYGVYRKKVIEAVNSFVRSMKEVWDAYPLPI